MRTLIEDHTTILLGETRLHTSLNDPSLAVRSSSLGPRINRGVEGVVLSPCHLFSEIDFAGTNVRSRLDVPIGGVTPVVTIEDTSVLGNRGIGVGVFHSEAVVIIITSSTGLGQETTTTR